MGRLTVRIATVAGIPIYLHWSFWLLLVWVAMSSFMAPQFSVALLLWRLLLVGGLVLSVILHELGHAFAARAFGIPTRDITMYPFGGVASLARIPDKPLQELVVALAGPLVNFLLIGVFVATLTLAGYPLEFTPDTFLYRMEKMPSPVVWLYSLSAMNGILAIFNLLPAFPMDGGRVLRALLATQVSYVRATRIAAIVGQVFAVLFILLGIYGNPVLILVGFFVFVAAAQERQHVEQRSALQGFTVKDALMQEIPTLSVNQTIADAIALLLRSQARSFLILDPLGRPAGSLSREQLIEALNEGKPKETALVHIMDSQLVAIPPNTPLHEAMRILQEQHKPFLLIAERDRPLGYIDAENIAEFLLIRQALSP